MKYLLSDLIVLKFTATVQLPVTLQNKIYKQLTNQTFCSSSFFFKFNLALKCLRSDLMVVHFHN